MSYTKLKNQPDSISRGEIVVQLDDGTIVGIKVVPEWLPNGGGLVFKASARHIQSDGSACLCSNGQEVSTAFSHTALPNDVDTPEKINAIAREMMLAMLGEQTSGLIEWSNELRSNINIRLHASIAPATIDIGSLI